MSDLLVFHKPAEVPLTPNQAYSKLASEDQVRRAANALELNGIKTIVVETAEEARAKLAEVIPAGAQVFTSSSTTLSQLGLLEEIDREDGRYDSVRVQLSLMDRATQGREMQKLGATPDYIVGSVHAVSETGSVLVASSSGSQLGPYASTAAKVVWLVGTQKIVPTLEDGLNRIDEYSLPLEDQRAQKAYGAHSSVNKLLVINREMNPNRTTMILIKENLGF